MSTIASLNIVLSATSAGFVQAMQQGLNAQKAATQAVAEAQHVYDSTRTGVERLALASKLSVMHQKGMIDAQTYARAVAKAKAEAAEAHGSGLGQIASALPGGSFLSGLTEGGGIGAAVAGIQLLVGAVQGAISLTEQAIETGDRWVEQAVEQGTAAARLAQQLQVSAEFLTGLESAAKTQGIGAEELTNSMRRLERSLGDIASGEGKRAAEALEKMGIDAEQFAGLGFDDKVRAIADGIATLPDAASRATVEVALLGKTGQQLDPLFTQGSAGIDKAIAKAHEMGVALTDVDVGQLRAVAEAGDEISQRWEGMKNQLTLALAPAILDIITTLNLIAPSAKTMGVAFAGAFGMVVETGAAALDILEHYAAQVISLAGTAFSLASKVTAALPGQSGRDLKDMAAAADAVSAGMAKSNHFAEAAGWLRKIQAEADAAAKALTDAGKGGADAFDDTAEAAKRAAKEQEDVVKTLDEMQKKVDEFGMRADAKAAIDVAMKGGSPEQIHQAADLARQLEGLEAHKKALEDIKRLKEQIDTIDMTAGQRRVHDAEVANPSLGAADKAALEAAAAQLDEAEKQHEAIEELDKQSQKTAEEAGKIWEKSLTPLEKYRKEIEHLKDLHETFDNLGFAALDDETFNRAINKAKSDYEKQSHAADLPKAEERRFTFLVSKPRETAADDEAKKAQVHARATADELANNGAFWARVREALGPPDQIATFG